MGKKLESILRTPVIAAAVTLALWCGGCPNNERADVEEGTAMTYNGDGTYSPAPDKNFKNYSTN